MTLAAAATPKRASRRTLTVAIASLPGATLFWAGNYIVGAGAVESIDPLTVIPAGNAGVFLNFITVFPALFTVLSGHPHTFAQIAGGVIVVAGVLLTSTRARRGRSTQFFWRHRRTGNLEP